MPADRRMTGRGSFALAAAVLLASSAAGAAPTLDAVYTDNAVIQRDRPVRVSGSAAPGERLTVTLAGQTRSVSADRTGRWAAELQPMSAGGPHRLTVTGSGGATAAASNILVGDVWLCSGQSNMEWPVRRSLNGEAEAAAAKDGDIRLLTVAQMTAFTPQKQFEDTPRWQVSDPQSTGEFSAACYFMARELRKTVDVPLGLIDASWGGTRIRPWMDTRAAEASGSGADAQLLELYARDPAAGARAFAVNWGDWWRRQTGDAQGQEPWNASERLDWKPVPKISLWDEWEGTGFADFNGLVWLRKRFTLTPQEAAGAATLSLGIIDDLDQTWINGVGVGNSFGWSNPREYRITPGILRAGENEIVINVADSWGAGGLQGPADRLRLVFADGRSKALGSGWEYSIVNNSVQGPPRAPWDSHAGLGTIYNAMIAPLGPYRLRGVAWYQGESDVGVPRYDRRLAAMTASWRRQFGDPDLPFLIVGLAGFGQPKSQPSASGWAELQDQQRQAAARDPASAFVPALDLGERDDIHPPNKQEVGRRLALAARSLAYRDEAGAVAPLPLAARRTSEGIEIRFTRPLQALSGARPLGFELCGTTQESCRFADGRISGARVILADDRRPASRVRYAWSDFAIVNLYSDGLPAPTFELPID